MKRAFSLVELSIVLVILGLLTGGILTGQSLIRAAELRSVTTEFQNYQTAVQTFRGKYFSIPGDMRNATAFWNSAGGSGTLGDGCEAATGTGTQTCNGNGDGVLDETYSSGEYDEEFTFWQHLANAGLVEGSYTGIVGPSGNNHAVIGTNIPQSKLSNAGWAAKNLAFGHGGNSAVYAGGLGNYFVIGSVTTGTAQEPIFTPEEVWNIDKKIDDGRPAYGKLNARYWDECTDATAQTDLDSEYLLTETGTVCGIYFREIF